MTITRLLTPLRDVPCLFSTDTVRDAFDHLETHELGAAVVLERDGRYVATVTEADLRRHVAGCADRATSFATPLAAVERRSRNPAVTIDHDLDAVIAQAHGHCFVPIVDDDNRLIGVVERRRVLRAQLPSAA